MINRTKLLDELEKFKTYLVTDCYHDLKHGDTDNIDKKIEPLYNFMNDDDIIISEKEYDRLDLVDMKMNALEAGGVDNWEWYSDSLNNCIIITIDDKDYSYVDYIEYLEDKENENVR